MSARRFFHIHEQVADHLRAELCAGRWKHEIPGRNHLVSLLEVSGKTVDLALQQLEAEGLLVAQGVGKKRRISLPEGSITPPSMRIHILPYEMNDLFTDYYQVLKHRLEEAGHQVSFTRKSLEDLGMKPNRVARFVNRSAADAWIVCAGSREVLAWFSEESIPVFALFGRRSGLPIAGASPRKIPAMQQAVDELVGLGHRRIVMLSREERCLPEPDLYEAEFLKRLETIGIDASNYHLPHWRNDANSFHRCLDTLFGLTPPTALFVNEPMLFISAMLHLTRKGLRCPEDVSMVCDDPSREFLWCRPSVTHIAWDAAPLIRRVLQWAGHVAQGRKDIRQSNTLAKLIRGASIGPAPQCVREIQGSAADSPDQRD